MFKKIFQPFKINLLKSFSIHNRMLQNAKRIGTRRQEGSDRVQKLAK